MPGRKPNYRVLLWAAATAIAAVVLGVLWTGSDYANTSVRIAAAEPSESVEAGLADRVAAVWGADTGPADVGAVEDSTVVVGSDHGVRGLDPVSGDERWHYLRSTAVLCDWTAADGVVVAVFRTDSGCDEALALDAGTGQREWYRSVNFTVDVGLSSTNQLTVAHTSTGITVLGTTSNGVRWRYDPPEDCLISDTLPGDVGVAVTLSCAESASLVLLDGFTGEQRWTGTLPVGASQILTADGVVGVLARELTGSLQVFDRDGVALVSLREPSLAAAEGAVLGALLVGERLAVFTGIRLLAVNVQTDGIDWVAPALTRAALPGSGSLGSESLESGSLESGSLESGSLEFGLLVFDGTDFVQHDVATGAELRRITVDGPAPPTGGAVDLIGSAIVASTLDQVAVYR